MIRFVGNACCMHYGVEMVSIFSAPPLTSAVALAAVGPDVIALLDTPDAVPTRPSIRSFAVDAAVQARSNFARKAKTVKRILPDSTRKVDRAEPQTVPCRWELGRGGSSLKHIRTTLRVQPCLYHDAIAIAPDESVHSVRELQQSRFEDRKRY